LTRTVVKVDHFNLVRIREEALETQEQLIVTDEMLQETSDRSDMGTVLLSRHEEMSNKDVEKSRGVTREPSPCHPPEELTLSFSDGWKALKVALTDIERKAVSIALRGATDSESPGESIKALADENGIMLEVLADSINEKAADCIGDSILEIDDEMILYDEYRENITGMLL